jgi:hypothetical protein
VVKKTKKVKKFRSKFKPIHYFLRIFIKKIKKNNLKKYRRTVKSFFRVFKCSLKLLLLKGFLKLNKNKINNKPLKKKPSNYDVNVNSSSRFLKNRFINKHIIRRHFTLNKNLVSQKITNKLIKTLNNTSFKPLNSLFFLKTTFIKKLINYGIPYYKGVRLNTVLNQISTKRFNTKILKKFLFKPYRSINVNYDNTLSKLSIISKYKTPFILSNLGFMFIQNININIKTKLRSKINRYKYSFFYLNDIKRFFLKKPSQFKLLTSSLFSNNFNKSKFFNVKRFNGFFGDDYNGDSVLKNNLLMNTSKVENFVFKDRFLYNKHFNKYFKKEVRIKRIKFKPGYSRI